MATVHVGANADPHPSIILVPPEGWPVPTEGRRASSTSTSSSGASAPFVPRGRTHCKPGRGWSGGWLARKDSNLQSPDPESGALPFGHSPPGPEGLQEFSPRRRAPQRSRACTLAHVSLSVSVRLKTRWSGLESESGVKYPSRSNCTVWPTGTAASEGSTRHPVRTVSDAGFRSSKR
jgi:hypothetical protein